MEAIKIQIEVSLSDATLGALALLAGALVSKKEDAQTGLPAPAGEPAAAPTTKTRKTGSTMTAKPAAEPEVKPEPEVTPQAAETAAGPVEVEMVVGDLPISDEELLTFIAKAKTEHPVPAIKEVFAAYGITCSTACPQDKRQALMDDIAKLPTNA